MPVHIFSVSACMTGCNVFKWLGKDTRLLILNVPHPSRAPPPLLPFTTHPYDSAFELPPQTPPTPIYNSPAPKNCGWSFCFSFFLREFMVYLLVHNCSVWTTTTTKNSNPLSVILSKLFIDSWRVQVRFAASGSTGRMSPLKQWSWTSPLVRGSSEPRTSSTASCRKSTPSPSKPTTVEKVLMEPTWRNPTSESTANFKLYLLLCFHTAFC